MSGYHHQAASARATGIAHGTEPYQCPELRPIVGRSAPKATALPSRRGNRLYHPCGKVTDLAGQPIQTTPETAP